MRVAAVVIGLLGLLLCVMNYFSVIISLRNRKRGVDKYVSPIPFLSAVVLLPGKLWALSFLAFLLDHTFPSFIYAVVVKVCFRK